MSKESLSIKNLGHVSKYLGMGIENGEENGYKLDQEGAISDLLRDFRLMDATMMRVPIMDDCYELQTSDEKLLMQVAGGGKPSIKDFSHLSILCCGLLVARDQTSHLLYTSRPVRRTSRGCTIGKWRKEWLVI